MAKANAHNLLERLKKDETAMLLFQVTGVRQSLLSYLKLPANDDKQGASPLVAIQTALTGKSYDWQTERCE